MKTKRLGRTVWTSDKYGLVRFDHARSRYNLLFHEIEEGCHVWPLRLSDPNVALR
jgi:hypothetical protein